jgi:dihydrodipicolinate synthase/N-acetylneuraminate lyase
MPSVDQIRGMFVPVPTPFRLDGDLDEAMFAELVNHYIEVGGNALFLFGSVGQGAAMPATMRKRGLEVALDAASGRVPVVPNVGTVDPFTGRELGIHAREHGCIAVGLVGPYYYNDRSTTELVAHVKMVDDATNLPLFVYNNPAYQGYSIEPNMMAQIREAVPNMFGLKIAKGGISDILRYQSAMGPDFKLFAPQQNIFPGMLIGQAGSVSPPLTMAMDVGVALIRAIDDGDHDEALRIQMAIYRFSQSLAKLSKWGRSVQFEGLRHAGFDVQMYPRWPTVPMSDEARQELFDCIDAVRSAVAVGAH